MFEITATDIPASLLLGALPPKTLAGMYLDAVDAFEFIKSEDCRAAASAAVGGVLQAVEAELSSRGLSYEDIEVTMEGDHQGHPRGEKLERLQTAWFDSHRGW